MQAAKYLGTDTNNRPASCRSSAVWDQINSTHKGGAATAFCAPLRRWQRLISSDLRRKGGWGGGLPRCKGTGRLCSGFFWIFSCFPKQVDVMTLVALCLFACFSCFSCFGEFFSLSSFFSLLDLCSVRCFKKKKRKAREARTRSRERKHWSDAPCWPRAAIKKNYN